MTEQNTPPLDDESLRLLEELEGEGNKSPREKLEARAVELGVKFRGNTGDATIQKRIDKAEAEIAAANTDPDPVTDNPDPEPKQPAPAAASGQLPTITNVSKNHRRICRVDLAVGESYTLTAEDLEDERLIAKLTRAIELGVLESD